MNGKNSMSASTSPDASSALPTERQEGEWPGAGSSYTGTLNERANQANTRNQGPSMTPSSLGTLPVATNSSRNTGRVGS